MTKQLLRSTIRRAIRFWTTSVATRTDYARVWDIMSQSESDARCAVAGYADAVEWQRSGASTAEEVARETGIRHTDVVLEIGCGAARVGVQLAPKCARWIGADVSKNMLAHAAASLQGHPNVSLVRLNGHGLTGIADETIDVVYCTTVFMHLEEWDRYRYVCEAYRVLRPAGRVYVDNLNLLSADGWAVFEALTAMPPAERPPHISKASTPQELETYVERAGFVDRRTREGSLYVTVLARKPEIQRTRAARGILESQSPGSVRPFVEPGSSR